MAKKELIKEDSITTQAGATLKPDGGNASHEGDPKSKFETLASMIGATHAMRSTELTKWWKEAEGLIGKEARLIPGGSKEKNSSSIDAGASDAQTSHAPKTTDAMPKLKEAIQKDIGSILDGQEGLPEEFKKKAAVLFETAISTLLTLKETEMQEEMEAAMAEQFDAEINELVIELAEATDKFLDHIAEQWFSENEVAIESSLRNELSEEFITGLKTLFMEHFINIPDEKIDVIDSLAEKVDELEAQLSEVIDENLALKLAVEESEKERVVEEACEGLTLTEQENFIQLASAINADDVAEFTEKLQIIRDSNFQKLGKKLGQINEQMEEVDDENNPNVEKTYSSPAMKHYAAALSRQVRK